MSFWFQFRNFKIVYRRYAGLYFCFCVDVHDNNLYYLEAIHNFVEVRVKDVFLVQLDYIIFVYNLCKKNDLRKLLNIALNGWEQSMDSRSLDPLLDQWGSPIFLIPPN